MTGYNLLDISLYNTHITRHHCPSGVGGVLLVLGDQAVVGWGRVPGPGGRHAPLLDVEHGVGGGAVHGAGHVVHCGGGGYVTRSNNRTQVNLFAPRRRCRPCWGPSRGRGSTRPAPGRG